MLQILAVMSVCVCMQTQAAETEALHFEIIEGQVHNEFYQQGSIAAHLLATSGTQPRLLVAFPAGNSGVGVWFARSSVPMTWTIDRVEGATQQDQQGRTLRGITADLTSSAALNTREAVLSSVRLLRDFQLLGEYPREVAASVDVRGTTITWSRSRLDGAAGYKLSLEVENGKIANDGAGKFALSAENEGVLRLKLTALTGEKPLTPLGQSRLLNTSADQDPRSSAALRFLSYEEKFLAGSWRFDTYFGRDTLMSLRLLMPALQPEAIERGLISVLERLAPNGEVAHEEDIGEFALLRHRKEGRALSDTPIYDYKMIDDDYMLAPVAAAYVLDTAQGRERARSFLAIRLSTGESVAAALIRNLEFVVQSANAFAQAPQAANLIALKEGADVGEWRDSEQGLAGGRYPYNVNAVFVPAALSAIARIAQGGHLQPYVSIEQKKLLSSAEQAASTWSQRAPELFKVRVATSEARERIAAYAKSVGVTSQEAIASLPTDDLVFHSIALDAQRQPIPVMHSDGAFALLFGELPDAHVREIVTNVMRPFPAGLLTDAGLLVANPAVADAQRQKQFGRTAYHGTVTWSWQQALLAAGLDRQLARANLASPTRERLRVARRDLTRVINNVRDLRSSELWSWEFVNGKYRAVPFGQSSGDADESNAAQLWSTVYLAIPR